MVTFALERPLVRDLALGFAYWLAFLLALEPGNLMNNPHLMLGPEFARIVGAAFIGATATPVVLAMARRYPIESRVWWRGAAIAAATAILTAVALIFVSCALADWFLATEHRPFLTALPQELSANLLLLVFCITGLFVLGHVLRPKARNANPKAFLQVVTAKSRGRATRIAVSEIDWIESQGNYLALHVGAEVHLVRDTLAKFEAGLDPSRFTRIHRSTIVALDRIRTVESLGAGDARILLTSGEDLRLSRGYRDRLPKALRNI